MAAKISLKLSNRSPKQSIKKLPPSLEIPGDATVEDVKTAISRQAGVGDFNRIGLFDATSGKILKDRKALIREQKSVLSSGELLVKDLGPQIAWRTVYMVEYLGPILFHLLIIAVRPYVYVISPYVYKNESETPVTEVQTLVFAMFIGHFVKRELETVFIHKFSANTMPAFNIFRNSAFYWLLAGLVSAYHIYAPQSLSARDELVSLDYVGIALFAVGEICNFVVHRHLAGLRSQGGTEKGIPNCIGSSIVTCPNYMFEVIAWIGVILVSRSWAVALFIAVGTSYMRSWSKDKEKALRQYFGDRYKKKRYTMLPGLI